jgi:hypothetical protein
MNVPQLDGCPFSREQIAAEMMAICGCSGNWKCNCTSVQNMAIGHLYYRKNSGDQEYGKDKWHVNELARIQRELDAGRLTAPGMCGKMSTLEELDPDDGQGYIKVPKTADEAVGMVLLGVAWLRVNAPDRLKDAARECVG